MFYSSEAIQITWLSYEVMGSTTLMLILENKLYTYFKVHFFIILISYYLWVLVQF